MVAIILNVTCTTDNKNRNNVQLQVTKDVLRHRRGGVVKSKKIALQSKFVDGLVGAR